MKIRFSILLLAGCCFLCGCHHEASIPGDSFRLTVQDVISDADVRVSLLTIRLLHGASISIDRVGVVLPETRKGAAREAEVLLSATRVAPSQDKSAYIQTLIRARTGGGSAGGASVHPVPTDTTLDSFFSISAAGGTYKLDEPVTVAQMQGKPVTLIVGRPTK